MSDSDPDVFVRAFKTSGFTVCIIGYRNLHQNVHLLADIAPVIHQATLTIYGKNDRVAESNRLLNHHQDDFKHYLIATKLQ